MLITTEQQTYGDAHQPEDGKKEYIGILKAYENKQITIETDEGEKIIERKLASKIRTVFDF